MGSTLEFPATSQSRVEWWGEPQYTRKGMLIFTILFGALGLHHFYLRSPQTGIFFIIFNILSLGYWYFFDIIQLSTKDSEELNKYGLDIPWWGPAGIAQGMWKCGAQTGGGKAPNPTWFLLYMICLPILPLSRILAGDPYNSFISILNLTVIPFGWIMNILSGVYDFFNVCIFPGDIFYNGIKRQFPYTLIGWEKDGFSRRITGKEKSIQECEDDNVIVRIIKGVVKASLPLLEKFLPAEIVMAIQNAIRVKEQVVDRAISMAQTGTKIATQVGKLAVDVPVAVTSGLASAQGQVAEAVAKSMQVGGGSSAEAGEENTNLSDTLAVIGIGTLVGGAFLLNAGRSFFDAVQTYRGATDLPLPLSTQEQFEAMWNPADPSKVSYPILINFGAKWCGPCQKVDWSFLLEEFAGKFAGIYKCDVDENKYTPGFCGVRKIPSWCILKGPKQMVGPEQISDTSKVATWIFSVVIKK